MLDLYTLSVKKELVKTFLYDENGNIKVSNSKNLQLNIKSNERFLLKNISYIKVDDSKFIKVEKHGNFVSFFNDGEVINILNHSDPYLIYSKDGYFEVSLSLYHNTNFKKITIVDNDNVEYKYFFDQNNIIFDDKKDKLKTSILINNNNLPEYICIDSDKCGIIYFQYEKYNIFKEEKVKFKNGISKIKIPDVFVDHFGIDVHVEYDDFEVEHKHIINGFFNTPPSRDFLNAQGVKLYGSYNYSKTLYKSLLVDGRFPKHYILEAINEHVDTYNSIEILTNEKNVSTFNDLFINNTHINITLVDSNSDLIKIKDVQFGAEPISYFLNESNANMSFSLFDFFKEKKRLGNSIVFVEDAWLNVKKIKDIIISYSNPSYGIGYVSPFSFYDKDVYKNKKFEQYKVNKNICTCCKKIKDCRLITGLPYFKDKNKNCRIKKLL